MEANQSAAGRIIDQVNDLISNRDWKGLDDNLAALPYPDLPDIEIVAWLRSVFPVQAHVSRFDECVKLAQSVLAGRDQPKLLRGLLK